MFILTSNTPGGITTYIECSAMPTRRQWMPNSRRAMFTEDSMCFDVFPVLWATFLSPTSPIQYRLSCLTTSRSGFSTSWRRTNGSTSTMQLLQGSLDALVWYMYRRRSYFDTLVTALLPGLNDFPVLFWRFFCRASVFLADLDSCLGGTYSFSLPPLEVSSADTDLAISRGIVEMAPGTLLSSLGVKGTGWQGACLESRLSIKIVKPESNPIIPAIHQTQFATKRYWFSLTKDIIFSRAWTITSELLSKVKVIRRL